MDYGDSAFNASEIERTATLVSSDPTVAELENARIMAKWPVRPNPRASNSVVPSAI